MANHSGWRRTREEPGRNGETTPENDSSGIVLDSYTMELHFADILGG